MLNLLISVGGNIRGLYLCVICDIDIVNVSHIADISFCQHILVLTVMEHIIIWTVVNAHPASCREHRRIK